MNNSKYKTSGISHSSRHKTQQGSVLLWGLVILLTLTVIGVAAARMGVTDIRIAGNQIYSTMTYQSAESGLESVSEKYYVEKVTGMQEEDWVFLERFDGGDGAPDSAVTVRREGTIQCPAIEGVAVSVEMNSEKFSCTFISMDSRARLPGTGTNSRHFQGVVNFARPDEANLGQ